MANFKIERFKRLPQKTGDVWEGGLFTMPAWLEGPDGQSVKPRIVAWVSPVAKNVSEVKSMQPDDDPLAAAMEALLDFGFSTGNGARPSVVAVNDPELVDYLEAHLSGMGIDFDHAPELNNILNAMGDMVPDLSDMPELPGPLDPEGVTVDRMRSFAEAAAEFYAARPWDRLTDEDLIVIERPRAPAGLKCCAVLGAAGQTFGLGFFKSVRQYEQLQFAERPDEYLSRHAVWSLTFGSIEEMPPADGDLWQTHGLAVEASEAYPFAAYFRPKVGFRRPNPKQLAFLEGLLRAIAQSREEQLDEGRWSINVPTFSRTKEFCLSIPALLRDESAVENAPSFADMNPRHIRRAMERSMADLQHLFDEQDFGSVDDINAYLLDHTHDIGARADKPRSPAERAQALMYDAWEARGRRRRKLANQALSIYADCADAYVLLAEESTDPKSAIELFRKGVEAAKRTLGPEPFKADVGDFWWILETRPYMRAMAGLAQCLWDVGERDEAVKQYQELLRLNPGDNQGIRYLLAPCLLELGRDKELFHLLEQFDDGSPQWQYLVALAVYRNEGDTPLARKRLKRAIKDNPLVPTFLLGERAVPMNKLGLNDPGGEDEAAYCASELDDGWRTTPGAMDWLKRFHNSPSKT